MKNPIPITVAMAFLQLGTAVGVVAQVSVTGQIYAEVIEAITTNEFADANFEPLLTWEQGGSLIVVPAVGTGILKGTAAISDNRVNPALLNISGAANATFAIVLPGEPNTLTRISGSGTLTVTGWTATSEKGDELLTLAGGAQRVMVGATLTTGSFENKPKGIYSGSYPITFVYN